MIDFGLWVECEDEESLIKHKDYFNGLQHMLLTGRQIIFGAGIEYSGVKGVAVGSWQICENGRGIETLVEALESTEAGIFLYNKLRTSPDFSYAYIGWNAENHCDASYLSEYVKETNEGKKHWSGGECVINDKIYKELGSPVPFWKFREGYWWQKYNGETYNPLWSDDQEKLIQLCEKLLSDNFDR